jgi:hypothetical protein
VLRHSALFLLRPGNGPEEMKRMQMGSAYMRFAAAGPVAIDFGSDLFGGSLHLYDTKPWDRTPRWRSAATGPPSSFDVALHLDFADDAGLEAYNKDDVHHDVAVYNAEVSQGEMTARVDWWYDGDVPLITPGRVRHAAMFLWKDEVSEVGKGAAMDAVRRLEDAAGVERITVGTGVGSLRTDFDWILDVQLADAEVAERLMAGEEYQEAMRVVSAATKHEWTARITHMMHGH